MSEATPAAKAAWARFQKATASAWATYRKATAPARAAYEKAMAEPTNQVRQALAVIQQKAYRESVEEQLYGNWDVGEDRALEIVSARLKSVRIRRRRGCSARETASDLARMERLTPLARQGTEAAKGKP